MLGRYKLEGHEPVKVDDIVEWAMWFENADTKVARTTVGSATVSTVFLGLDLNFLGYTPHLFETMIFAAENNMYNNYMWRYATWDEAVQGHEQAVAMITRGEMPPGY